MIDVFIKGLLYGFRTMHLFIGIHVCTLETHPPYPNKDTSRFSSCLSQRDHMLPVLATTMCARSEKREDAACGITTVHQYA